MSPHLQLIAAEFRRQSTYRLALAAGVCTNGIFGLIRAGVLLAAVEGAGGTAGGYDARTALLYVLWGQALLGAIPMWGWSEIADRVRTGEIAVDLARPIDLQVYWWFRDLGRAAMQFLGRGLPILVLGSIVLRVAPPAEPLVYLAGLVGLLLGLGINYLCRYALNLISFWTVETQGFQILYMVLVSLLTGFTVPVHLFPDWLKAIAEASPFPSMYQYPVDLISGRTIGAEVWSILGLQLLWLAILLVGTRVMTRLGTRRLVIQGG